MYNQEKNLKNIEYRKSSGKKIALAFLFSIFYSINSFSQCAMCRAVLETEEGGIKAEAVNDGIVYLMVVPYLLVAIIGFLIYKMYQSKKKKAE